MVIYRKDFTVSEWVEENVHLIVEKIREVLLVEHPGDRGLTFSHDQVEALLNPQGDYLSLTLFLYLNHMVQTLRKPQDLDFNDYHSFLMGELANASWEVAPLVNGELDSIHDRFLYTPIISLVVTPLRYQLFISNIFHGCLARESASLSQEIVYDVIDHLIAFHSPKFEDSLMGGNFEKIFPGVRDNYVYSLMAKSYESVNISGLEYSIFNCQNFMGSHLVRTINNYKNSGKKSMAKSIFDEKVLGTLADDLGFVNAGYHSFLDYLAYWCLKSDVDLMSTCEAIAARFDGFYGSPENFCMLEKIITTLFLAYDSTLPFSWQLELALADVEELK